MICMAADKYSERPIRAFFIDSENGAERLLEGMEFLTHSDLVIVFHRGNFPVGLKSKLELGPSAVEWIKCVDPGVKNSMDVQIIAELAMRLAGDGFKSAFIVSEDKGYLPAIHYLQQTSRGGEREVALVKDIVHAAMRTTFSALTALKCADSAEDIENALAPMYGESEARSLAEGFERVFAKPLIDAHDACADDAGSAQDPATEIGCGAGASAEAKADSVSFVDLPGIGRALAGKLESAGISSPAELEQMGAVEAWERIHLLDKSFPPKWVYSFEAAIKGVPVNSIDPKRKRRLKSDIKAFVAKGICAV